MTEQDPSTRRRADAQARRRIRELIERSIKNLVAVDDLTWFDTRMCELEDLRTEVIRHRESRTEFSDPETVVCTAGPQDEDFVKALSTVGAFVSISDRTLEQYGHTPEFQRFIAGTLSREMVKGICPVERALSIVQRWADDAKAHEAAIEKAKHRRLPG